MLFYLIWFTLRDNNLSLARSFGNKRGTKLKKTYVNARKMRYTKESKRKYSNLIIANNLYCNIV